MKQTWLIQVQIEDKEVKTFTVLELKRRLKGSGVEVDASYPPLRVAPGRFVGRGFATEKARVKASRGDVLLFKELQMSPTPATQEPTQATHRLNRADVF